MEVLFILAVLSGTAGLAVVVSRAYRELGAISQQSAQLYHTAVNTCNNITAISRENLGCYQQATSEMIQSHKLMLQTFEAVMKLTIDINSQMQEVADTCHHTSKLAIEAQEKTLDGYNLVNVLAEKNAKA